MWVSMNNCCLVVMHDFRMHLRRYKADRCMWNAPYIPTNDWNSSIGKRWIDITVNVTGMAN
jgi:hypothetical protein